MGQALATGDVLRGKYRLEQVLGRGGMGIVHLATHVVIGQRVAIKIVKKEGAARFLREARAAAHLESEHVVRILDVDETDDGTPFMVMEYLHGEDLGARIRKHGRMPVAEAVGAVLQASEALAEAHAAGIIHRDLKPSNLFRAETARKEPIVKLLDFGISKLALPGEDLALTDTQAVIGSPLFMSPEQLVSSRTVDHRTDIWSIGVTLYQLLAAALPFEASTAAALGAMIASTTPRPLREVLPEAPTDLEAAVMRCLARDAAERFEDILAFVRAIAPFAPHAEESIAAAERAYERGRRGRPAAPPAATNDPPPVEASGERWTQSRVREDGTLPPMSAPPPPPPHLLDAPKVEPQPIPKRRSILAPILVVAALLVAGIIAVVVARRRPTPPATVDTTPPVTSSVESPPSSTVPEPATVTASASIAKPAPKVVPKKQPPARPASSWSKDPSELELK